MIPTPYAISHDYIVAGQFDWHFGGVTVTDIPSVLVENFDYDISGWVFSGFVYDTRDHQVTNELKVYGDPSNPLQWLGGLYLLTSSQSMYLPSSNYDVPQFTLQNVAPYGQLTYSFTDALKATVGARYTSTYKDITFAEPAGVPRTSATWSNVDWKGGLEYDLGSNRMLYLTAQSGSSPGTMDPSHVVNGGPTITDLTKLYSLTAGWKSQLLDNRLQLNDEIFYYDYKDFLIQTVICGNPVTCYPSINVFLNAPKLISFGDQLDVRWLLTAEDSLNVSLAATSAKTGTLGN
jgi:iron complex outermembrane receptor protein